MVNTQSIVETICNILVLLHAHVFIVIAFLAWKIVLIVTYIQEKKLGRN